TLCCEGSQVCMALSNAYKNRDVAAYRGSFQGSFDLKLAHPLYIRKERIVQGIADFARAICLSNAADGILDRELRLESKHRFDFVRIHMVGAIVAGRSVFQLDRRIFQR